MKYFIQTFGCQQNVADSERLASTLVGRGMEKADSIEEADYIVVNSCMIRETAENRVYGLVNNLAPLKDANPSLKIVVTGCMVGAALRDPSGVFLKKIRKAMPAVDEFMPIEEVGFDFAPVRTSSTAAWVPISNGCNNFCTFCIVPFTRGREISRPYTDIIEECKQLVAEGYTEVTLLGQNVNSYGSDLMLEDTNVPDPSLKPVYVMHLGKRRIPTLFPHLLEEVARLGFRKVDFVSSNPWDFSDELISVIARNPNITRTLHLPVQHGDTDMLRRMNRWYTREEYLALVEKIKKSVPDIKFTTDIIVGFCDETEEEFNNLVDLCKQVGFYKAYISMYSSRPLTNATKIMTDSIPHPIKKKRWTILDTLINTPNIQKFKDSPSHMHKKQAYITE